MTKRDKNREGEGTQSRELEAIGQLSAKVGHDVNNLLGSIRGCVDLIKLKIDALHLDPNPIARQIAIVESAVKQGTALTDKLRGYVRPEQGWTTKVAAEELIQHVIGTLKKSGSLPFEIEVNVQSSAIVEVNDFVITQMLTNIVLNSVEAMEKMSDRCVVIHLSDENLLPGNEIGADAGSFVRISIMDHGEGMSDSVKEQVFNPFFSTKKGKVGQGIGLSLSMAQEIMKRHRGALALVSGKGVGTVVHLYFPVVI